MDAKALSNIPHKQKQIGGLRSADLFLVTTVDERHAHPVLN